MRSKYSLLKEINYVWAIEQTGSRSMAFCVSGLVGGLLLTACDLSGCSLVGAGIEVSFFLSEVLASVHRG